MGGTLPDPVDPRAIIRPIPASEAIDPEVTYAGDDAYLASEATRPWSRGTHGPAVGRARASPERPARLPRPEHGQPLFERDSSQLMSRGLGPGHDPVMSRG